MTHTFPALYICASQGNWRSGLCWRGEGERKGKEAVWEGCLSWTDSWTGQVRLTINPVLLEQNTASTSWITTIKYVCTFAGLLEERWRSFPCLSTLQRKVMWLSSWFTKSFFRETWANMRYWLELNPNHWFGSLRWFPPRVSVFTLAKNQTSNVTLCFLPAWKQIGTKIYEPQGLAHVDVHATFLSNDLLPLVEKTVTDKKVNNSPAFLPVRLIYFLPKINFLTM